MAKEDKTQIYILTIVGVVAAVAIVVLLMNASLGESNDLSGQATATMKIGKTKLGMEAESTDELKPPTWGMEAESTDELKPPTWGMEAESEDE